MDTENSSNDIAIIGMAGRFPGANNVDEFWSNIVNKVNSISHFSQDELMASNIPEELINRLNYVKNKGYLKDADFFDAEFFKFSKHEAEILDPQYRLFFETTWEALEDAAYVPDNYDGKISIFAGSSNIDSYHSHNLTNSNSTLLTDHFTVALHNAKDFLSLLIAYKLNLRGAAVTIQTTCSTSLVAVCLACQNLLANESDIAIAGGACVTAPLKSGYLYQEGMMLSPTGQCNAFDQDANGTVLGNGAGVVVLKRLSAALRDRDNIHAVIKGFAVNNDGSNKIGFTAPGISGQQAVIQEAINKAGIKPEMISYIETHGTGTILGDLIEFESLSQVFKRENLLDDISLSSVKPNIGHLDAASGVASLIKATQAVKHHILPPNINFNNPSLQLDFKKTPFKINTSALHWASEATRYAGVSSFGIGGTNAHVILQEAPKFKKSDTVLADVYLILSARSPSALDKMRKNLLDYFKKNLSTSLVNVAYTLQIGRKHFKFRTAFSANTLEKAIDKLEKNNRMLLIESTNNIEKEVIKWLHGADIDWREFFKENQYEKISLPPYPFEKKQYWITNEKVARSSDKYKKINIKTVNHDIKNIEKTLKKIFERFFAQKNIDIGLSFNQLGGDSLVALLISHEINKVLQLKLPLTIFDKNLSIQALACRVENYLENQ